MSIRELIRKEFENVQRRHAEEIRELAVRCAELRENDANKDAKGDGSDGGVDLLPAALEVVRRAKDYVEGKIGFESLRCGLVRWNRLVGQRPEGRDQILNDYTR